MPTPTGDAMREIADAICVSLADWLPSPLNRMAYEDASRAALAAMQRVAPADREGE